MPGPSTSSVVDAATNLTDQAIATQAPEQAGGGGILGMVGQVVGALVELEQALSAPFAKIPFPALPALRILDADIGLPHAHLHPPNLIPPLPPVPFPSVGLLLPIPFLSGASTVFINGIWAARCGDMGIGIWCGGFFPVFEIFLGSASVWVEGARAGRTAVDIAIHCNGTLKPQPRDPAIFPFVGFTVTGSGDVMVGGIPMPSLTNWIIGQAMKLAFKGIAKLASALRRALKRLRLRALPAAHLNISGLADDLDNLTDNAARAGDEIPGLKTPTPEAKALAEAAAERFKIVDNGDAAFRARVISDLEQIAMTPRGKQMLETILESGQKFEIHNVVPGSKYADDYLKTRAGFARVDDGIRVTSEKIPVGDGPKPPNAVFDTRVDPNAPASKITVTKYGWSEVTGSGNPGGGDIFYKPTDWPNATNPQTPSYVALGHEMGHAENAATGNYQDHLLFGDQTAPDGTPLSQLYPNAEEHQVVTEIENAIRSDHGLELRPDYKHLP